MIDKEVRTGLYSALNYLLTLNHTCLKVAKQDPTLGEVRTYTRDDIFNRSADDRWVSRKLEDISRMRNAAIESISASLVDQKENLQIIESELEKSKEYLITIFNIWFETDKKFEEVFDGFLCLDPQFHEMVKKFETSAVLQVPDEAVVHLLDAYTTYMDIYGKKCALTTFSEITDAISDDFTYYGRPSNKGVSSNKNLVVLKEHHLTHFETRAKEIIKDIDHATREENKKYIMLCRKYKKRNLPNEEKESYKYEAAVSENNLYTLNIKRNIAEELLGFVCELKERFESACTDVKLSMLSNIIEGVMDYISGVDTSNKPKREDTYIYAHTCEINYIKYLLDLIDLSFEKDFIPQKQQPTKQPGDGNN